MLEFLLVSFACSCVLLIVRTPLSLYGRYNAVTEEHTYRAWQPSPRHVSTALTENTQSYFHGRLTNYPYDSFLAFHFPKICADAARIIMGSGGGAPRASVEPNNRCAARCSQKPPLLCQHARVNRAPPPIRLICNSDNELSLLFSSAALEGRALEFSSSTCRQNLQRLLELKAWKHFFMTTEGNVGTLGCSGGPGPVPCHLLLIKWTNKRENDRRGGAPTRVYTPCSQQMAASDNLIVRSRC